MKTILPLFCLLTAVSFFNAGCKDENKYKKEIGQLDSMLLNLSKVTADTLPVDTMVNDAIIASIQKDLNVVDTLLPDTISDKQLAILLMEYHSLLTPLKQGPLKMGELKNEAKETSKRITDLKTDLTKDIADEKQVNIFVETEKNNTNTILSSFNLLNTVHDSILKKTDAEKEMMKGKINELLILKKEKKKKK